MSRYFFDIYNSFISIDGEGVELTSDGAAHEQVRVTLPALLKDLKTGQDNAQMRVDVRSASGDRIISGTILMVIERVSDRRENAVENEAITRIAP